MQAVAQKSVVYAQTRVGLNLLNLPLKPSMIRRTMLKRVLLPILIGLLVVASAAIIAKTHSGKRPTGGAFIAEGRRLDGEGKEVLRFIHYGSENGAWRVEQTYADGKTVVQICDPNRGGFMLRPDKLFAIGPCGRPTKAEAEAQIKLSGDTQIMFGVTACRKISNSQTTEGKSRTLEVVKSPELGLNFREALIEDGMLVYESNIVAFKREAVNPTLFDIPNLPIDVSRLETIINNAKVAGHDDQAKIWIEHLNKLQSQK